MIQKRYRFKACRVLVDSDPENTVRIDFADRLRSSLSIRCNADLPIGDFAGDATQFRERAGYASESHDAAYRAERVLCHIIAAECWGLEFSPVLWTAALAKASGEAFMVVQAAGITLEQLVAECDLVGELLAYFNGGEATDNIRCLAECISESPGMLQKVFHKRQSDAAGAWR